MHETDGYPLRSYVFVTTEPGTTAIAVRRMLEVNLPGCRLLAVDQVMGGFDIIAKIETVDLDSLARAITDGIRELPGVVDVRASWCLDSRGVPEREQSGRPGGVDVISVAHR